MHFRQSARALAALLTSSCSLANAQTFTKCNPTQQSCPADPALGTTFNQTFSSGSSLDSSYWTVLNGPPTTFDDSGISFTIQAHGDSPTIQTNFYIFWGTVEVIMKAAPGTGIISSIVLLSDDLDEIDWEIMGGNTSYVENNYYGKGNTSERNAQYFPCDGPQEGFHNYTTVWNSGQIEWHLDGNIIRTLAYGDATFDGANTYPQTPMFLKIGNWAGGDPSEPEGTIQWAGGVTNYNDGPFTMVVQSVKVTDGTTNATSYLYGDRSGTFQSIEVTEGESAASQKIHAPPPLTVAEHWANISTGAKIAIICGSVAVSAALAVLFGLYCVKQRRLGKKEAAMAEAQWERDQAELLVSKQRWARGEYAKSHMSMATVEEVYPRY